MVDPNGSEEKESSWLSAKIGAAVSRVAKAAGEAVQEFVKRADQAAGADTNSTLRQVTRSAAATAVEVAVWSSGEVLAVAPVSAFEEPYRAVVDPVRGVKEVEEGVSAKIRGEKGKEGKIAAGLEKIDVGGSLSDLGQMAEGAKQIKEGETGEGFAKMIGGASNILLKVALSMAGGKGKGKGGQGTTKTSGRATEPVGTAPEPTPAGRGAGEPRVSTTTGESQKTVGRWMSREELKNMRDSGRVQEGGGGQTRVADPADPSTYKAAPKGDVYVEFDVPAGRVKPHSQGTGRIPGPHSPDARLAAQKGQDTSDFKMPKATNIKEY